MIIHYNTYGDYLLIYCSGRLDSNGSADYEFELCRHIFKERQCSEVVLDMSNTTFVCSAGLRVLLGLTKRLKKQGRNLHIQSANDVIQNIIELAGFHLFIDLHDEPIVALEQLREAFR